MTQQWHLTFHDEFDGDALDTSVWTPNTPWTPKPFDQGELQTYSPSALHVATDDREGLHALYIIAARQGTGYRSGMISTFHSFAQEYGRFEIRCDLPKGQGLWPAFWLLPAGGFGPPEIDVMEAIGSEPNTVYMTTHWAPHGQAGGNYVGPDFAADAHTFAVEWSQDALVWFVDGVERHREVGHSPAGPMYLLANLAVGGDWPGAPDASTPFPAVYAIDAIRVYQSTQTAKKRRRRKRSR